MSVWKDIYDSMINDPGHWFYREYTDGVDLNNVTQGYPSCAIRTDGVEIHIIFIQDCFLPEKAQSDDNSGFISCWMEKPIFVEFPIEWRHKIAEAVMDIKWDQIDQKKKRIQEKYENMSLEELLESVKSKS